MDELNVSPMEEDAILKEVWNDKNIEVKTELTDRQIEGVNKALALADVTDDPTLNGFVFMFMKLQKSRDRKSMTEFVDSIKAKREDFVGKGKGFFNSMLG